MSQTSGQAFFQQERHITIQAAPGAGGSLHVTTEPGGEIQVGIKTVKGAPYSAETKSETIQTLANGNRIIRGTGTRIYRDSEGRTRQEYTFRTPGDSGAPDLISINDPVAGVSYSLHAAARTAEKITHGHGEMTWTGVGERAAAPPEGTSMVFIRKTPGPESPSHADLHTVIARDVRVHVSESDGNRRAFTNEPLGIRVMEGLQVEGKRTTVTVPAGTIGNEQPLVTVTETWFSPELQTVLYSKREDPMAGTTTFEVTKVVRGEPDPSLFQVPPGYTVNEAKVNVIRRVLEKPAKKQP